MPRRKKAAASPEAETDGPVTKRQRTSAAGDASDDAPPEIQGRTVQWDWEGDSNVWTPYSQQFQALITDAYNNGETSLLLSVSAKVQMKIDFQNMVQKNKATGWERRLRLNVKNASDTDYHVWEWQDEHSRWNPYGAAQTLSLEDASDAGDDLVSVTSGSRHYTVSLTNQQQENDATGVKRSIRREPVDASKPSTDVIPQPEATASAAAKSTGSKSRAAKGSAGAAAKGSTGTAAKGSTGAAAKGSSGRGKSGSDTKAATAEPGTSKSSVRTLVMKGAAPVDPECTAKVNTAHVYSRGKDVYDAMLNQTNLSNNNNKYYLMQVLEDDSRKAYSVWFRWGRVGYKGQTSLVPCGPDLDDAIDTFTKKFYDKTKNDWANRNKFQKYGGKYDLVKMDYSTESLIDLICDVKRMEDAVIEMKYDAKKAPLGKLTPAQIKAGYAALKVIDALIEKSDLGSRLVQACDEFYTRIPHDFGMRVPPVIRTKADVKLKISLLEALSDIEIAMNIIRESNVDENPLDTHYNSLKCNLDALDRTSSDFKMIEDYLKNTHAPTHNQYKMEILDVFNVDKAAETSRFSDKGNRMLLWHGSRLTNWVGILSQGLRIAPPEAPVTGYMFGKGVYFADMSSKSANYCYPSQAKNEGLLLLCEVSLGKCNELLAADYKADQLPSGTHSVMGKGSLAPDPKKNFKMSDGCVVPLGKCADTGVKNPTGYTLNYNEFIVYDLKQIKMKYLLRVKFNFK